MAQVHKNCLHSALLWKCSHSCIGHIKRISPTVLRAHQRHKVVSKGYSEYSDSKIAEEIKLESPCQTCSFSNTTPIRSTLNFTRFGNERFKNFKGPTGLTFTLGGARQFSTTNLNSSATVASATESASAAVTSSASTQLLYPDFFLIRGAEGVLAHIHQLTGLPWWSSIVLTAFLLRVVLMIPLTVHTLHNTARLQRLQPEVKEMTHRLKKEVSMAMIDFGWDKKRAKQEYDKNLKRLIKNLYIRDNCHPMKSTATFWVQFPMWISVTYALRNMSTRALDPDMEHHTSFSTMTEEGTAWFPDLTCTDSTWLLPVMMGAITLFNVEINYLNISEITKYRKYLTLGLRTLAFVFIPISAAVPNAMVLYWVSSGTFTAIQNVLFEYSPFRRLVGLPKSPVESNSPLKSLATKARSRYFKS